MQPAQYGLTATYPGNKVLDTATLFASTDVQDDVDIPVLQDCSRQVTEHADTCATDVISSTKQTSRYLRSERGTLVQENTAASMTSTQGFEGLNIASDR